MFRNEGDGSFTDVGVGLGVDTLEDSRSVVFFDMDRDGDLDLLATNINEKETIRLFRNDCAVKRNWLMVQPVGVTSNRQAVGAMVKVTVGGKATASVVVAGQGFQTSYSGPLHFGLGDAQRADKVEVIFPGGETKVLTDVAGRQWLTVYQDGRQEASHLSEYVTPKLR